MKAPFAKNFKADLKLFDGRGGRIYQVPMERLSFKGTVDSVRQFSVAIAQARTRKMQRQLVAQLLEIIAQDQVPDRPGRRDPRAVKRRPTRREGEGEGVGPNF